MGRCSISQTVVGALFLMWSSVKLVSFFQMTRYWPRLLTQLSLTKENLAARRNVAVRIMGRDTLLKPLPMKPNMFRAQNYTELCDSSCTSTHVCGVPSDSRNEAKHFTCIHLLNPHSSNICWECVCASHSFRNWSRRVKKTDMALIPLGLTIQSGRR